IPQLYIYSQILVASDGYETKYGSPTSDWERFFVWEGILSDNDLKVEEIGEGFYRYFYKGKELTSLEVLIMGLFRKENLLEFLRDFVAYGDEPPKGKVKKIARHMQWRAVRNAFQSAQKARQRGDGKGGTIWHWQGSGKTLTMLWLTLKLRREFNNPCIIILTDRRELDNQIKRVLSHHGFPNPYHATSVKHLKELLEYPTGKTILVTLQKLGSKVLSETGETEHLSEEK
ncbi:MAG: DEAD/DEAH box helicase family protein, partial [Thermoplasmata archaeon]